MTPEWLITAFQNILSLFVGLFSGLLLTHFVDESKSSLFLKIFIIGAVVLFIVLIIFGIRNDRIKKKGKIKHEKANIAGINVTDLLPENLPEQNSMLKNSSKPILMGMVFAGRRHNLIKKDWCKDYFNKKIETIVQDSSLAASDKIKEYIFKIPPNKTCEIHFIGKPIIDRRDYLFSIYTYNEKNDFRNIGLYVSISNEKNELIKKTFSFKKSNVKMIPTKSKFEVYQPYISHLFSSVPEKVKGLLEISNNSEKDFDFVISFPTIEEGLFPTEAMILCGESLGNGFLTFERKNELLATPQGVMTIVIQPFFNPDELTPGINPIFLHCVNQDNSNGIEIFCDSKDNGKVKAKIINNNTTDIITSDISLFKNYVYGVSLRWSEDQVDLVVNGRNTTTLRGKSIPKNQELPINIFLGCSPLSVDDSANSIIAQQSFDPTWKNNKEIETALMKKFPIIFNSTTIKN